MQLGIRYDTVTETTFDEIILEGPGGWSYETNVLLGWALSKTGSLVIHVYGGVARSLKGVSLMGNHLVLLT